MEYYRDIPQRQREPARARGLLAQHSVSQGRALVDDAALLAAHPDGDDDVLSALQRRLGRGAARNPDHAPGFAGLLPDQGAEKSEPVAVGIQQVQLVQAQPPSPAQRYGGEQRRADTRPDQRQLHDCATLLKPCPD